MQKIHKKRIKNLQSYKKNILILNSAKKDPNFFYYTGMDVDYGALWIPSKGKPIVMMSEMDSQKYNGITPVYNIAHKLKRIMKGKTVYVNYDYMSMSQGLNLGKLKDASKILAEIRTIKTKEEIDIIRQNALISEKAIKEQKVFGRKETDVAADINSIFFKEGGQPAYDTIVAGGRNTKSPHHMPKKSQINGICYIDAGMKRNGYVSDITRTFVTKKYKKQLQLLLDCINKVEEIMKPGVEIAELDKVARKALGKYEKYFIHALGHGIGLETHEAPLIHSKAKGKLEKGMTITIEPGIYTKTYGLRVENDYVITRNGFERLSKSIN